MRSRASFSWLAAVAFAAGLLTSALPAAHAGEAAFCVTCSNPDQTYLCRVTGEGSSQNDALKLYCIVRTAKEGHHASCAANGNAEGCNGEVKAYNYEGPSLPDEIAQDPRVKKLMGRVAHDQAAFSKPKGKGNEPKTLVELTGRAVSASRQRWRSTFGDTPEPQQSVAPSVEPALPPLPAVRSPEPSVQTANPPPPSANPPAASTSARVKYAAQSAGAAVGGFARTTARCFRSWFRKCRSEGEN
jgi:hypothetical protein